MIITTMRIISMMIKYMTVRSVAQQNADRGERVRANPRGEHDRHPDPDQAAHFALFVLASSNGAGLLRRAHASMSRPALR